jgi:hypothetical protein
MTIVPHPIDGKVGSWILDADCRLNGPRIEDQVPQVFEGYLRVLHSASDGVGERVRWADVARQRRRLIHPQVQWHCLVGAGDLTEASSFGNGEPPALGELSARELDALMAVLGSSSGSDSTCFFGLSTIHGGMSQLSLGNALLTFPFRQFVIFECAFQCVGLYPHFDPGGMQEGCYPELLRSRRIDTRVGSDGSSGEVRAARDDRALFGGVGQAPNLIWPSDHSWYVLSDIDFDSTLVGGSRRLLGEIAESEELECVSVSSGDSLAWTADILNC